MVVGCLWGIVTVPFYFEDHVLDDSRRELSRGGETVLVEPKVFDLLVYLIENGERLVTKDDLIAHVWDGRIVSDSALTSAINAARKAIGDNGRTQRLIRTSARKGFRFIGSVRATDGPKPAAREHEPALPVTRHAQSGDKPSIAVLPFQNMSSDPEQEYFTDGIVEDITTALSRFKSLFVIARNSSFTYKGKVVDIKQVGRELGVRYVLEGSVRKAGDRVRITGQLIDSETGAHLWADRFDGALEDIFDLQDQVTGRVVAAIAPRVTQAEVERARHKPTESLTAYDYCLRGAALYERRTKEAHREARALFERAIELDPGFSTPYAMIARCHSVAKLQGWAIDAAQAEAAVRHLAERVSELGTDDAFALSSVGFALVWVCRDYDAAAAFGDRALAVNPNLVHAWMSRAMVSTFRGDHDQAIEQFARAKRISPVGNDYYLVQGYLGYCHALMGRYDEALRYGAEAVSHHPNWLVGHLACTVAHALKGNLEEARKSLGQLLRSNSNLRLSNIDMSYSRLDGDRARLTKGLRLAGLPE